MQLLSFVSVQGRARGRLWIAGLEVSDSSLSLLDTHFVPLTIKKSDALRVMIAKDSQPSSSLMSRALSERQKEMA